ncbi:MAG: MBL fold metallo-hydrolase, partial [Pseudomonadota bacterium]|nr:MBL fold metallo-hydrolase [Pseudomonadota bacterium]
MLAWLAGVGSQLHERSLLPLSAYVGGCLAAVLLFAAAWLCRRRAWRAILLATAAAAATVQGLDDLLAHLAAIPGAVWVVPVAPLWAQMAGLAAAALIVMPLPWRARLLAGALVLALLVPSRDLPIEGSFDLIAADVGQGMSVLVRTRGHVLLFDTGPQYSRESDAGQRVLVPLLRSRGDEHVDLLMLSHRDLDHVGGALTILHGLDVDALSSSLEPGHPIAAAAKQASRCEAGQHWRWDRVDFAVLRPLADDYARTLKSNAMSCVLHISGGGRSALLVGDIERDQETLLVDAYGSALRSDVLVVPHHGSRTSSSVRFIEAVQPKIAVFQTGYRNRFGHPARDVVERYRERGAAIVASPA